jgi:iron complex transport system substrate-binding protein
VRWLLLGALLSTGLAALAGTLGGRAGEPEVADWRLPLAERRAAPFPRTLPGVVVAAAPTRAVAASVLSAEVLLELVPDRLVAVHFLAADQHYSTAAARARDCPRTDGSPESILSFRPDLVLTDPFTRAETQVLLQRAGVAVVRAGPCTSLADVRDNLRRIGYAMGLDDRAEDLVTSMDAQLAAVRAGSAQRAAWHLLNLDGLLNSYGRGSLFDDLVGAVGAVNVAGQHGVGPFRRLEAEEVLGWRPDALVVGAEPEQLPRELERLRQHPALRVLPCVQQGRIICVAPALLASTSHHAAGAAVAMARMLDAWGRP